MVVVYTALSANEDSTADTNKQKGKKARKQVGDVFSIWEKNKLTLTNSLQEKENEDIVI